MDPASVDDPAKKLVQKLRFLEKPRDWTGFGCSHRSDAMLGGDDVATDPDPRGMPANVDPLAACGCGTVVLNFRGFCQKILRNPTLIINFFMRELGTGAGYNSRGQLFVLGGFPEEHIRDLLEGFVRDYVLCSECNRLDSALLLLDGSHFLKCNKCSSERYIGQAPYPEFDTSLSLSSREYAPGSGGC